MVGEWLDPKIRAIGMRPDYPQRGIRRSTFVDPGHQCAARAEVPATGIRSGIVGVPGTESGFFETAYRLSYDVERAGGGIDISTEVTRPVFVYGRHPAILVGPQAS